MTYGPGVENTDLNLFMQFRITEKRILEFRFQAFNALNHFNPGNPATALALNCGAVNNACTSGRRQLPKHGFRHHHNRGSAGTPWGGLGPVYFLKLARGAGGSAGPSFCVAAFCVAPGA